MGSIRVIENRKGTPIYYVQIRLKGFPSQSAHFNERAEAKAWIHETEKELLLTKIEPEGTQEDSLNEVMKKLLEVILMVSRLNHQKWKDEKYEA